jgi:chaperonin GroEL (HSP60 family)
MMVGICSATVLKVEAIRDARKLIDSKNEESVISEGIEVACG